MAIALGVALTGTVAIAFGAIAEIVRILEADPATAVPGGVTIAVTGAGRTDRRSARWSCRMLRGLITEGGHHQPHHLAMARGQALGGHAH